MKDAQQSLPHQNVQAGNQVISALARWRILPSIQTEELHVLLKSPMLACLNLIGLP